MPQRPNEDDLTEYHAMGPHREVEYFFASDARLVTAAVTCCSSSICALFSIYICFHASMQSHGNVKDA